MRITSVLALLAFAALVRAQPAVPPAEPYKAAVAELEKLISHEVDDKKLPAVSVALVDDQTVVWAAGFGFRDRDRKAPATAETVYRVGSVSKLFTDVAVMQLVEEGKIDIDAPVTKYIPEFKPIYKDGDKQITLRMLMSHRSGLIREPPVGNYFDPAEPTLAKTVASLNGIGLIYSPESRIKYSNAAIGVVGYALEKSQDEQYEKYVQRRVIDALGMKSSSFLPTAAVKKQLADAVMWTYHGREFPAPTFELGEAPAGCMYSTVLDLAKFQSCLFAGGKVGGKPFLKPETLAEMFRPQYAAKGEKSGFGLGFSVGEFEGTSRVGHGGAIYGFSTSFVALPGEKLGAVVVSARDASNAVTDRIANDALRLMLAAKAAKPLPKLERSEPLPADQARQLAGRYRAGERWGDLYESFGKAYFVADRGGARVQPRKFGSGLISDDVVAWGNKYGLTDGNITTARLTFVKDKSAAVVPPDTPAKYKGLIGEYGFDHLPLIIYERDGKLHALIELTEIDPLTELSENEYAFPAGNRSSPRPGAADSR